MVDETLSTVQITGLRGGRVPATRLFYSTVSNNNFNQNPAMPPAQPTFPTNSLFRGNDRRRKAPKKSLRNRKGCLSCLTDFKNKPYTHNDVCLNPLRNSTEAESRFFNVCPETSEFCQIEVFTVNGVFSGMERRCSTICKPVCFQRWVVFWLKTFQRVKERSAERQIADQLIIYRLYAFFWFSIFVVPRVLGSYR